MEANTVPLMPSVADASIGLVAPAAGPGTSKADVGERSVYYAQLQALRGADVEVDFTKLGDASCTLQKAAHLLEDGSAGEPTLVAKMDKLSADMVEVKTLLIGIKAGQANVMHRNMNGMSRMLDHKLQPLEAELGQRVGECPEQPDLFPATLDALTGLNTAKLNALQQFYGCEFNGATLVARRNAFAAFIGALSSHA